MNPTKSNNLNERVKDLSNPIKAWRVGPSERGFYALDPMYYSHSATGYNLSDAKEYSLDLSKAKVLYPISDWGLYANSWSDIRRSKGDSNEFFDELGIQCDETDEGEAYTDTDSLAQWGEENGYDAVVLEGIPGDHGYGPEFDEVYVANPEKVVVGRLSESTKVYGGIRMTESPYEMADILRNSNKGLRIIYDPRKDWYIYDDETEHVHVEMMRYAIEEAGLYPGLRYYEAYKYMWSDEPDSPICMWFRPKGPRKNEMVGHDQYTEEMVYPFGHLAGRCKYLDFPLTEGKIPLVGNLGKPIAHYVIDDYKVKRIDEPLLVEKTRQQLLQKSRTADDYAPDNRERGRNRYERRRYSKVSLSSRDYNSIDMNALFKGDILEFGIKVQGETDDYVVTIIFERILEAIRREVEANGNVLKHQCILRALLYAFNNDDVYISCSCPDWKYRMAYWATKDQYDSGFPEVRPSVITNPKDTKGAGCKHSLLALSNTSWMQEVATVIYNYIKVSKQIMQRNYAEVIFPAIYGRPYKGVAQASVFDKDDRWGDALLPSDKKTLDDVIAGAMSGRDARGRFSSGNPYAFRKSAQPTRRDPTAGQDTLKFSKGGAANADDKQQPDNSD